MTYDSIEFQVVDATDEFPFVCPLCKEVKEQWDYLRIWVGESSNAHCVHLKCLLKLLGNEALFRGGKMIKTQAVTADVSICDCCGNLITWQVDKDERIKYTYVKACIICGKNLCSACGANHWTWRGRRFRLCPEHNPTLEQVEKAISEKLGDC